MDNHISGGFFFGTVVMGRRVQLVLPREITPALTGLPRREGLFVGRGEDVTRIVGQLERSPVVTIVGMPGVGKTALAVEAAWRAWKDEGRFPGGVLYIELHGYDARARVSTEQALVQLLQALAVPPEHMPRGIQELTRLYRSVLGAYTEEGRRLLVVVDDTSGEEQAAPLLPTDGYHAALVVSRQKLVLGEARTVLRPLDTDASVELLRKVLGPENDRVDGDRVSAERIVDLCGHLPLALWISAALLADIEEKPLAVFASELAEAHRRLDKLSRGERTVRAAFDLSYQRLETHEARIFRLLAVNPGPDISTETIDRLATYPSGGVTVPAALVPLALESLARAHLIEVTRWGRWGFHDLVRLYAEERAAADAREELARSEAWLGAYYLETAAAASRVLNDVFATGEDGGPLFRFMGTERDGIRWLDDEYANLLAATVRAQADGSTELSAMLPVALRGYLRLRRVLPQWTALLERAVSAADSLGDLELTGMALDLLGLALQEEGQLEKAVVAARDAVECFQTSRQELQEAVALCHLGTALARMGRHGEAVTILRRAVDRLQRSGGASRAHALKDLAEVMLRLGRFEEAERLSEEAASLFWQPLGDEISAAEALLCQGSALLGLGQPQMALVYLLQAHEHFGTHENLAGLAATLNACGRAAWSLGRQDEAAGILRTAAEYAEEAGDGDLRTEIVDHLIVMYTSLGRAEEAAGLSTAATRGTPTLPPPDGGGRWWRRLGRSFRRR
ncbi:tetratricopeptide repeat protein [Streptomyces roseolus]|uniref:tetratricopeptide repeat protein n=1 Tax=Streptomyces roseolus TaxID=67358 RepID=UPI0037BB35BE